jgi:hypothetical protein
MALSLASVYPDWPQYAARIRGGIGGLNADQLAIRGGPEHAPIWALAAHVAAMRMYWLCGVFGEPGADATPWPNPLTDPGWEDDESHPRSAAELTQALDATWTIVRNVLDRWTVDDLGRTVDRIGPRGDLQVHTRASVLNRACTQEAFHAGEISQLLGLHHLPAIDLWAPQPAG